MTGRFSVIISRNVHRINVVLLAVAGTQFFVREDASSGTYSASLRESLYVPSSASWFGWCRPFSDDFSFGQCEAVATGFSAHSRNTLYATKSAMPG